MDWKWKKFTTKLRQNAMSFPWYGMLIEVTVSRHVRQCLYRLISCRSIVQSSYWLLHSICMLW